jgi:cell division protease FtsH
MKKPNFPKLPAWLKTIPKWLIMVGVFLVIFFITNLFSAGPTEYDPLQFAKRGDGIRSFDTAISLIKKDSSDIERITYGKDTWGNPVITIERTGTTPVTAGLPPGEWATIKALADEKHIPVDGTYQLPVKAKTGTWREAVWTIFAAWIPYLIMAGVMLFLFKRFNPMNAGKNKTPKHRIYPAGTVTDKLDKFAGNDEAKLESVEIIEFLQNPAALAKHGAVVPRGALMVGEPGNGKTLLARCIAGEAGVAFISISGSDFVEMFVGMGAKAVRDLFEDARKLAPCIIFIDEIDAVGRQRGTGMGGGNDEREQTLNQLLVEMDGFDKIPGVYVIAATNRADVLDKALLRAGRFTKNITVEAPDTHARKLILDVHRKGKNFAKDVDFDHIANSTWNFSGADIAELMNRSVVLMLRRIAAAKKLGEKLPAEISSADIEDAIIEGTMKALASKSSSRRQDPAVKRMLAYHEGGHGLVTEAGHQRWLAAKKHWAQQWGNPLRRLTIVGAAGTGGHMQATPDLASPVQTEEALLGRIASAVGATIAERMFTGTATTGNSNDLKQAYNIAKIMVTKVGMSKLGAISVGADQENPNLGRQMGMGSGAYGLSNESSNQIDQEILGKLATGCRMAIRALLEREEFLHALVEVLMEKETIARAEWLALWNKFEPVYISDSQVEAKLKELWPRFERLSVRRA